MKLERLDIEPMFRDSHETYEDKNEWGKYVYWTPELQEAWDKQQEMEIIEQYITEPYDDIRVQELRGNCPKCHIFIFEQEIKYCDNCGQRIKW